MRCKLRIGQDNIRANDWLASVKVRDYWGYLSVDGRLKFNWIIKKEVGGGVDRIHLVQNNDK
jgi:hypothetical protein